MNNLVKKTPQNMVYATANPRILIVTPEITYIPEGMGNIASFLTAKAGGLADVSSALVRALFDQGADVHIALPDYRTLFNNRFVSLFRKKMQRIKTKIPDYRIHLAEDRAFFYQKRVYSDYASENLKIALAFQRELINNIVPLVQPDLIHCNDWMTGLIPGMARRLGIPSLFTIHNIYTVKSTLSNIEDRGIDAADFWHHLYYDRMPINYEETRKHNSVDFIVSGVFAAHFINTVSPTFLAEIVEGRHDFVEKPLRQELTNKWHSGCAVGILNAPDPSYDPSEDMAIHKRYGSEQLTAGKKENKQFLQKTLRLIQNPDAPVFFWPSRLDYVQKGCQLLAEILYNIISRYWEQNLAVVFIANGDFQRHFKDIIRFHGFQNRVAICNYDEGLARLAYAASDFVLMPSRFEPCGLPQMIGPIYGSLPVAHDTGGIHDTVEHINVECNTGNGFLFETFDSRGLSWAIDQAMHFYNLPLKIKERHIQRIMTQSATTFNYAVTARQYTDLYEKMLQRPILV